MDAQYRVLLPAPPRGPEMPMVMDKKLEHSMIGKRRGRLVKIACTICQRRRVKCDGQRPQCSTCVKRGEACLYEFDAAANTTRYQALREKHTDLENLCKQRSEVLKLLRERPKPEALLFLERIRSGDSMEKIMQSAEDGDLLLELASSFTLPPTTRAHDSAGIEEHSRTPKVSPTAEFRLTVGGNW